MKKPSAAEFAVVAVIVVVLLALVPVWNDTTWIDPVTGSIKDQDGWLVFPYSTRVRRSAIEDWIIRHEGSHTPRWKHLGSRTRTITGQVLVRGCSSAPPIYSLAHPDIRSDFLRASSEEEIARFVEVMRTGTRDEQEAAVDAALRRISSGAKP